MRLRARVDENQPQVVKILRARGFFVYHAHRVGEGFPDLIVSDDDNMWLVEIKNGEKGKLTEDQEKFHKKWEGRPIVIIRTEQDAMTFPESPYAKIKEK